MRKLLLTLPLLAACTATMDMSLPDPGGNACGATGYASLVGKPLGAAQFPAGIDMRLINPGEMVTADFSPTRLNVEVDGSGTITRVTCG